MHIKLENIGKRFGQEWIIRNLDFQFQTGKHTVIIGSNGSGKSTLLRLISAYSIPTEGKISYFNEGVDIATDEIFKQLSYAGPYVQLIEKMTLLEQLEFHQKFKPFRAGIDLVHLPEILKMEKFKNKQICNFSSGMKMRLRLVLAILSDTSILLLDEPHSNLDADGKVWYRSLIEQYTKDRLVIVCSNKQEEEFFFCNEVLDLNI